MADIIEQQVISSNLVLKGTSVTSTFENAGFSKNLVLHILTDALPDLEVYAASMPQVSALGAALAIHTHCSNKSLPADVKLYVARQKNPFNLRFLFC